MRFKTGQDSFNTDTETLKLLAKRQRQLCKARWTKSLERVIVSAVIMVRNGRACTSGSVELEI